MSTDPSPSETPAEDGPPVPSARGRRRWLLLLAAGVGLVAVLGVGGLLVYSKIIEPDRSTPGVVADQFLENALLKRDSARAAPFVCASFDVATFIAGLPVLDAQVGVSWGDFVVRESGDQATVDATIRYTVMANGPVPTDLEPWRLTLVRDNGWRVCGVTRRSFNP